MPSITPALATQPVNIVHVKALHTETGASSTGLSLRDEIIKGLQLHNKLIPTVVLYDDAGLKIYDQLTSIPEYYPFEAELVLLREHGTDIVNTLCGCNKDGKNTSYTSPDHEQNGGGGDDDDDDYYYCPNNKETYDHAIISNPKSELKQKWGHNAVGKDNYGVNGNLGLKCDQGNLEKDIVFLELGAGSLRKTVHLLDALGPIIEKQSNLSASYHAIDLEYTELVTTLRQLAKTSNATRTSISPGKVWAQGICASYDDALPYVATAFPGKHKSFLWLGSSIGNFGIEGAVEFLKRYTTQSFDEGDALLIGVDMCQDAVKVKSAYDDSENVTRDFILNGLKNVERILGLRLGSLDGKFEYTSIWNAVEGRHEAYVTPMEDFKVDIDDNDDNDNDGEGKNKKNTIQFRKGEAVAIEKSQKYSRKQLERLFKECGLVKVKEWKKNGYSLTVAQKTENVVVGSTAVENDKKLDGDDDNGGIPKNIPSLDDWDRLWSIWDTITLLMVSRDKMHTKPIDLRHEILFYLGHIPAFLDIHLSKYCNEAYTEPVKFANIFERGIDPNIDDPSNCNDHSIVPEKEEEWPAIDEIVEYKNRVKARLEEVYEKLVIEKKKKEGQVNRRLCRVLVMVYEHQALHVETFLYMLVQTSEMLNRVIVKPNWEYLKEQWDEEYEKRKEEKKKEGVMAAFFQGTRSVQMGMDDFLKDERDEMEMVNDEEGGHVYGWDNESPKRVVEVGPFMIDLYPVTNLEYAEYIMAMSSKKSLEEGKDDGADADDDDDDIEIPASWIVLDRDESGSVNVCEKYGIRTVIEPGYVRFDVGQHWPVMGSGKMLADYAGWKGGRLPSAAELRLFYDEFNSGAEEKYNNVNFKNWHPVPPSCHEIEVGASNENYEKEKEKEKKKIYSNGGVWEWTSTEFERHEGFQSSSLYPGYSADFFDGCHDVVVGGSWATVSRIANRRSVVNWYQRRYPYVFAGGRVAYPLPDV